MVSNPLHKRRSQGILWHYFRQVETETSKNTPHPTPPIPPSHPATQSLLISLLQSSRAQCKGAAKLQFANVCLAMKPEAYGKGSAEINRAIVNVARLRSGSLGWLSSWIPWNRVVNDKTPSTPSTPSPPRDSERKRYTGIQR